MRVSSPAAIAGQPAACGSVGPAGNRRANHARIAGWKSASTSILPSVPYAPRRPGRGRGARRRVDRGREGRRRVGVYGPAQRPAGDDQARRYAEAIEQVRLIRALGFDSIWSGEHHATPGFHYFPLLPFLQRLAAEADGLWFGTNVILLPLHNPAEVAEIGAFLDVITGGRFMLGVGLGYRAEEFALFGVPMGERVSRLVEGIEIIRRLWTEDGVTHRGRHWQLDGVTIRPRPLQQTRPPILVGSQVSAGIARAARIADGWTAVPVQRVDEFAGA